MILRVVRPHKLTIRLSAEEFGTLMTVKAELNTDTVNSTIRTAINKIARGLSEGRIVGEFMKYG